jgi:hypothetical protein
VKNTIHIPRDATATDPTVLGMLIGTYLHKYAKRFPSDQLALVIMKFKSGESLNLRFHPEL